MKPRITLITLGVDDLQQSLAFYRDGLGLATPGIVGEQFEHGAVVFLDLQAGLKLAQPAFWGGYSGYFQDPDDHLWEVAWNPQFDLAG